MLGILQGVTEFLPVSSSGHLVLAQELLNQNLERGITFEIVVHFGSLFSILIYFHKRILEILKNTALYIADVANYKKNWSENYDMRVSCYILLSMIPAGIVGFTMKDNIEGFFSSPGLVSVMLIITGTILYTNKFIEDGTSKVTPSKAFLVGLGQAFAMLPGISRSGTTITLGNYLGIKRDQIAEFSFLMLVPIIAGAMILEIGNVSSVGIEGYSLSALGVGFAASLISGYFSLKYLIKLFKSKGLHYFSYYCWSIGLLGVIYFGFK